MAPSVCQSLVKGLIPAALSAGVNATIVYMGHSLAPFVATSVPHAALFGAVVSWVASTVSPCFCKMGMKKNMALSYTIGAVVALGASVGAGYVGITTSAVSLAGVIAFTIASLAVSILNPLPKMNIFSCNHI